MTNAVEYTFTTEAAAHTARRAMIQQGRAVSLIGFDGSRDVYAFDAE